MSASFASPDHPSAEAVFNLALELKTEDRSAYLAQACCNNPTLRERVEALLQAHDASARFLPESPTGESLDTLPASRVIGDYELLEEIARGGMGVVYRARQRSLDRIVALKMILAGPFASREQALRFRAEAEAAARLQHPNIVRIHEIGEHEGRLYFSMDYVAGPNLSTLVREKPLPARCAVAYVKAIAEAIHYAHEQGVLHRDLKPSNILIDVSDQPVVSDFGLAKRLTQESFLTGTSDLLGSPGFMPPEQCGYRSSRREEASIRCEVRRPKSEGDQSIVPPATTRAKAGRCSDVYGLGGILFYLITGRPPFVAETVAETLHQVLESEPVAPRLLNGSVPRDLETICLKCLEKDPLRRYASAFELIQELDRFLQDTPVRARPVSRPERVWRWCRRNRALAGTVAAVTALVVIVGIGSPIAAFRIERERQRAEEAHRNEAQQRRQAEANEKKAQAEAARSQQVARYLKNMLEDIAPSLAKGCTIKYVREVLTRVDERVGNELTDQPDLEAVVRTTLAEVQSDIGQHVSAELNLKKVLAMRRKLYGNHHPDVAASLLRLVNLLRMEDKRPEAEGLAKEAVDILERLVKENPERQEYRQDLGHSQWQLGYVLAETDRREAALGVIRQALQTFETAAHDFPANGYFRQEQAFSHRTLGDLMNELERVGETERHYHAALEIYAALTVSAPTNVFYRAEEAWTTWVFATKLERAGKLDTAAATYRKAVALYEKAMTQFPGRAELKSRRDSVRSALASLLSSQRRQNEIEIPPAAQPQEPGGRRPLTQPEIDAARNSKANRILPLVVMVDIPLADAIMNLARQADLKVTMDPRVTNAVPGPDGKTAPQPTVSIRWRNLTAREALVAVLTNYNLVIMDDPATRTARITVKDAAGNSVGSSDMEGSDDEKSSAKLGCQYPAELLVSPGGKASWSPGSDRIVFAKLGGGLAIMELQTRRITNLTSKGNDPAWSPDGRFIAYVTSPRADYYSEEVWIVPATGGQPVNIGHGGFPCWSADSRQVLLQDRKAGKILAVRVDATNKEPAVFFEKTLSWYPAISPDGNRIAFGAREQMVIVERKSAKTVVSLPAPGERGFLPAWSLDGRQVGFGGFAGSRAGLWVYDLERGGAFQVATNGNCTMPAWSPDGKRLVFDCRSPTNEIWMIETKYLQSQPPLVRQLSAQTSAVSPAALRVGDPAPRLRVASWVQGEPVKEFEPDKAYLVEFWATWCGPCRVSIPHLNELHTRLKDKGLIVIGQDVWEQDAEAVPTFIKKMGDNMTYRVALDTEDGKMAKAWMEAAEWNSIPTAFVVDKRGTIAWIGHPMKLSESLLNQVLAGTFDTEKATADYLQQRKDEEQRRVLWDEFNLRQKKKEWDRAEAALAEIESLLPDEERDELSMTRFGLLLDRKDYKAAYQLAAQLSDEHRDDAMMQNQIAWSIATKEGIGERDLALAEKIARRANAVAQGNFDKAEILDTLARVLFLKGEKESAIELQQKAVELAQDDRKRQFQSNVDDFKAGRIPNEAKINALRQKISNGIQQKAWDQAESALADLELLLPSPEREGLRMTRFRILLGRKNYKNAYKIAADLSDAHRDEAMFQNQLAWEIVTAEDLEERDLDLAEKIARRANEATNGNNAEILDTLARVLFLNGQKDSAIEYQQKAVGLAKGRRKAQFQETLESYKEGTLPKPY